MDWVLRHSAFLGTVASTLMLVVWVAYLHLFWLSYRRRLRADVVISRGGGTGLDALCLVSNMSAEPVLIEGMVVVTEHRETRRAAAVTSLADIVEDSQHRRKPVREGPLKTGDYLTVGTFRDLLALAEPESAERQRVECLEIWIVAHFGSDNDLVFARRRFLVARRGDRTVLRPTELETRRITRASQRREVEQALQEHLEEAVPDGS